MKKMMMVMVACASIVFVGCERKCACDKCEGTGKIECKHINKHECRFCRGTGFKYYGGNTLFTCTKCEGRKMICEDCKNKEVECPQCKGMGEGYKNLFGKFIPITAKK